MSHFEWRLRRSLNVLLKSQHNGTHEFIHCHSKWNKLIRTVPWLHKLNSIESLRTVLKATFESLMLFCRMDYLAMPENRIHPVILPKDHQSSTLVLKHMHEQLGRNHMIAKLRQQGKKPVKLKTSTEITPVLYHAPVFLLCDERGSLELVTPKWLILPPTVGKEETFPSI